MDDINLAPPPDPKGEELKRELLRESFDTIQVANPTDKDYMLDWDGFKHRIPAHSERPIARYLAKKYCREMKNLMINKMQDDETEKIRMQLEKDGDPDAVYKANSAVLRANKYRTDNEDLIKEIYPKIWLGVVEKYGGDDIEMTSQEKQEKLDGRPVEERLVETMNRPYKKQDVKYPINKTKKEDLVNEIAQ